MRLLALACAVVLGVGSAHASSLRFYGHGVGAPDLDRVKIRVDDPDEPDDPGPPVDVGATDFTIEFWMKASAADNDAGGVSCGANINWILGNIVIDRDRYNQDRKFGISIAGGEVVFGVSGDGSGDRTVCSDTDVLDDARHHVALQRSLDGTMQLFVDGTLEEQAAGPDGDISYPDDGNPGPFCGGPCDDSDPFIVIGAEKHDAGASYPSYSGWIDELRFSTTLRYAGNFTPPAAPFTPDAQTAGLYHLDEGSGNVVGDSSGATGGPSDGVRRFGGSAPAGPEWSSDTPFTNPTATATGPTPTLTPTPTATTTPIATPICGAVPIAGCRTPAVGNKALVVLKDRSPSSRDRLTWKWTQGSPTAKGDFGNPVAFTGYELCIYDGAGLRARASAPAAGLCGGKACWQERPRLFRYNDRDLTPHGLKTIVLKEGLEPGKAKITIAGKGDLLDMPDLSMLTSPLTVQLLAGNGNCWEAVYSFPPASKNEPEQFKDKAD